MDTSYFQISKEVQEALKAIALKQIDMGVEHERLLSPLFSLQCFETIRENVKKELEEKLASSIEDHKDVPGKREHRMQ